MIGNSQVFGQGESSKTGFFLNPLPDTVIDGEPIKFSGYLLTGDGTPLVDRTITIKQDISLGSDRNIETTTSDEYGYFTAEHSFTLNEGYSKANMSFYAKYINSNNQHYRTSNQNTVLVLSEPIKTSVLTLDTPPTNAKFGEPITFSGSLLTESDEAIPNKKIVIRDRDSTSGDDFVASAVTDSLGNYSVTVLAQYWDCMDCMFEVYAIFDSDTNYYTSDKTPIYDVWFSGNVKDTKLIFDSLPKSITSGETITFSGQLLDSDGTPLAGKSVQIKNHLMANSDDIIKTVTTNSVGKFSYSDQFNLNTGWKQEGAIATFYLKYIGDQNSNGSESIRHTINIDSAITPTTLILDKVNIGSANVGDTITFTGKLTSNGNPISGKTILIKENDFGPDEFLAKGITNSQGSFSIPWKIPKVGAWEIEFEVYAVFEYDGERYYGDQTPNQPISIYKVKSSITLDPIQQSAYIDEKITFTGTLNFDTGSSEGHKVYIKDEDMLDSDDTLAIATVDKYGRFSTVWYVEEKDKDDRKTASFFLEFVDPSLIGAKKLNNFFNGIAQGTVEIYAIFEGDSGHHKSTSCVKKINSDGNPFCGYDTLIINDGVSSDQRIMESIIGLYSEDVMSNDEQILSMLNKEQLTNDDIEILEEILIDSLVNQQQISENQELSLDEILTMIEENPSVTPPVAPPEPVVEQAVNCGPGTEMVANSEFPDGICQVIQTEESTENGGGCLIATATYGSEMSQQVQQLRELRDNQLLQTESGSAFMSAFNNVYYSFSPYIADMERENPMFKEVVKLGLTPMLSSLSIMENADSESEVLGLGLSVIALNLGMYLGVPVFTIIVIRNKI